MLSVIYAVDIFLLKSMMLLLRWGTEWLSLKRRWMERSMIVGYGVSFSVNIACDFHYGRHRGRFDPFLIAICVCLYLVVCATMWTQQKRPDSYRINRLFSIEGILNRIWSVGLMLAFVPLELLPPVRWFDMLAPLGFAFYAAFQYALSLPEDGERGKKRKLTLAKLKEMFGTSWITAPVPQPQ